MAERLFDIIFDGSIANGFDEATVRSNLGQLFKLDSQGVDKLFTGKAVALKRGVDRNTAAKYQAALSKAGARIQLRMQQSADPAAATAAAAASAQQATTKPSAEPKSTAPAASAATAARSAPATSTATDSNEAEGAWGVLPAGSDLLKDSERRQIPDQDIDVSHIQIERVNPFAVDDEPLSSETDTRQEISAPDFDVAAAGSDLLADRPDIPPPPAPDVSMISIADVGATLGDENSNDIETLDLPDIDDWSIAPAGSDILAEKPTAPEGVNPDISHLQMVDK
ncbi:hypothetical protein GYB62_03215 [bacterium]|nr:hypothetical protein [bacterium]